MQHRALYAAFDRVPSAKGAAMHIAHTVRALQRVAGNTVLACVADGRLPLRECEDRLEIRRLGAGAPDMVERVRAYRRELAAILGAQRASLQVCHFRDPWSGIPILNASGRWRTVYEVNGLPSIELPYRYPQIGARTLERVQAMERRCLAEADQVLTPSHTIARNLAGLGVHTARITVIPNGADLPEACARPLRAPSAYFIYFGALQAWQGVGAALAALAHLADLGVSLVICSSQPGNIGEALRARAERLGIADKVHWEHELTREALAPWVMHAIASLAPLTETARNLAQGCCPLKILESMAAGTPVIASDLGPVRELVTQGEHGLLVRPGRPEALARAMRRLADVPATRDAMGRRAFARIRDEYTWSGIEARLEHWYRDHIPARGETTWTTAQARSS